jgi:hypothetical protein
MGRFHHLLNDIKLLEVHLMDKSFTWSNEREAPTLVRLDRVLASVDWEELFPECAL